MEILEMTLPLLPAVNGRSGILRMHWAKRAKIKKTLTELIWAERCQHSNKTWPVNKAKILVQRIACGVEPDADNLHGTLKILFDALRAANVIVDDSPDHIEYTVLWSRAKRRDEQRTRVVVEWS